MNYAGINTNDTINGEGICVSFWVQGCPHHCPGCHNPETWNIRGGEPLPSNIEDIIINAIYANGIIRNFSILGGEPLVSYNIPLVRNIIQRVKKDSPKTKIFLWTGYLYENLDINNIDINYILRNVDVLIDGPFKKELRDITLPLRGSSNQRVIDVQKSLKKGEVIYYL